jgi:uncharacterized membrane protein
MSNPTYPGRRADRGSANPLVRGTLAVERAQWLDHVVKVVEPVASAVVASPGRRDLLQGRWLGHSAHPLLVTVPVGVWTGVSTLDVVGGSRTHEACRTLTGLGVLVAVPSALTGLAEWAGTNPRDRRTATVHALVNAAGLVLYTRSWLARRREQHRRGALLAATGSVFIGVGGFLGGHLTEARKVGSHHPAFAGD